MNSKRWEKLNNKAVGFERVEIITKYLNPNYKIIEFPNGHSLNDNYELIVLKLESEVENLPHFYFRSDENGDALDVDAYIRGIRQDNETWWHEAGYDGHHTERHSEHIFEADLRGPQEVIFRGMVKIVGLERRIYSEISAKVTGTWPTKKLGEVLELCDAGTWGDERESGMPLLRSTNMQSGKLVLNDLKYIDVPEDQKERYLLNGGDILITKSSGSVDHIGKSLFITKEIDGKYGFSNFTQRLRVKKSLVLPKWIYLKISNPATRDFLLGASQTTTGLRNLKITALKELEIPLPPLPEQKKIVKKIEELFGKIDEAQKLREEAQEDASALIPAALHQIFEQGKQKGWKIENLGKVVKLQGGFAFKSHDYKESGVPLVRIQNLQNNEVNYRKVTYLDSKLMDAHKDFLLRPGDILIAMSGATTGKMARVIKDVLPALLNQRVGRFVIVAEKQLMPNYLWYYLKTMQEKVLKDAYGGAQPNISPKKIEKFQIPLPPLPEQKKIVAYLDSLSEKAKKLQELQQQTAEDMKVLKQSILQKAFKGELVK